MDRSKLAPLTTWITPETLKALQVHKATSGLRIQDIVEAALVAHLKKKTGSRSKIGKGVPLPPFDIPAARPEP